MSKALRIVAVAAIAAIFMPGATAVAQTTIHVPADYATIQAAINAATSGDTVLVADGTYAGSGNVNLSYGGRAITVKSENGAANCTIDGAGGSRGVSFGGSDTGAPVFEGFTIANGYGFNAGGIACQSGANPIIRDCVIIDCFAAYAGGGVFSYYANPQIEGCLITGNHADYQWGGGGIALYGSDATIEGCDIVANTAAVGGGYGGGVLVTQGSGNVTITGCTFSQNAAADGGGLALYSTTGQAELYNCLFIDNTATRNGGGAVYGNGGSIAMVNCTLAGNDATPSTYKGGAVFGFAPTTVEIANSILWGNTPDELKPVALAASVTYSDVAGGYTGTGNIDTDPLFADPGTGDYHLTSTSPCINTGDLTPLPVSLTTDLAGEARIVGGSVDMGAYEFGVFDSDGDGLSDTDELMYGTDPYDADTDDDGLLDGTEVDTAAGMGCPDPLNPDSDGDTLLDGTDELAYGTDPCNADSDGDGVNDNVDPTPTVPGVPGNFIEEELRDLAAYIQGLDLSLFAGPNNNANRGRRNSLANRANAAANNVASGDYADAIDVLENLQRFVDGIQPPPEWMIDCTERDDIYDTADLLILLLQYL